MKQQPFNHKNEYTDSLSMLEYLNSLKIADVKAHIARIHGYTFAIPEQLMLYRWQFIRQQMLTEHVKLKSNRLVKICSEELKMFAILIHIFIYKMNGLNARTNIWHHS